MSTLLTHPPSDATPLPAEWSLADLQRFLGDVPAHRIRLFPYPGTATEDDAVELQDHEGLHCELVDGVLVEKDMASYKSLLGGMLVTLINIYLQSNPLGIVLPGDGPLRILPTRMRMPDVSFIRWERFPGRKLPTNQRVYRVVPDLVVEILSAGNTRGEMDLKLSEYRRAGVPLIWYIDPHARSAVIYTADGRSGSIDEGGSLDGRDVLPGFTLILRDLFNRFPTDDEVTAADA